MKASIIRFFSIILFFSLWQVCSILVDSTLIFPSFLQTVECLLLQLKSTAFYINVFGTIGRVGACFAISVVSGTVLGILAGMFGLFRKIMDFPMVVLKSTPVVALILIFMFAFKSSLVPVVTGVLLTLPVMFDSVSGGFEISDEQKKLLQMAENFQLTKKQVFRFIKLPAIYPFFSTALNSIFGMTWKVIVAGEVLAIPRNALGTQLAYAQVHLESQEVMAVSLAIVLLSFLFEQLLKEVVATVKNKVVFCDISNGYFPQKKSTVLGNCDEGINIEGLCVSFDEKEIFKDFEFSAEAGEIVGVIAPSGFGKTTLLNEISKKYNCSFMFQEPRLLEHLSAKNNIILPLLNKTSREQAEKEFCEISEVFELNDCKERICENLSGGQKQRVALARAVLFPGGKLLLDEPFSSIDYELKLKIIEYLKKEFKSKNQTVIFVTHDVRDAEILCDRIEKINEK